ncbi:hypothetical protein BDW69DRAFT_156058 [Aspergillus filifer]
MALRKKYLNEEDFRKGLEALDKEMGQSPWLKAFAPIKLVAAGGFLAISYLRNRETTGDLDYLIDPEFVGDSDVQNAFHDSISAVADQLNYNDEWINEAMAIFVTKRTRQIVFEQAEKQGIVLFQGENLEVLAAPIEWALERKLRRIFTGNRDRKAQLDMTDAVALLKVLRDRNNGPLDRESIRTMNLNGFDVCPDESTMQIVAHEYLRIHNADVFA